MELLDSNAPGLIHLLAGPSGSHVYLKAVNLYIRLKGLVFLTHVHKTGNLQTRTKCFHFRLLYKQWVPLTPCKVEFPSLESMLFKQPSIWKNVLEGGSYPHFSSSRREVAGEGLEIQTETPVRHWRWGAGSGLAGGRGCLCTVLLQPSVLLSTTHSPVLPRQLQEPHAGQWWRIHPLRRYCVF